MEIIFRSVFVYLFILLILRMSGKRTLSQVTTFDFVLLLIIGEATQQAIIADDRSIIGALLAVGTLVGMDALFAFLSLKSKGFNKVTNGVPLIILENGQPIPDRMAKARLDTEDILEAARKIHGLESLDQIKFAVLEKDGGISIIPN